MSFSRDARPIPVPRPLQMGDVPRSLSAAANLSSNGDPVGTLRAAIESFAAIHGPDLHGFVALAERLLIIHALDRARGVKLRAAQALGINRVTLDRKIAEHGLHVVRGTGVVAPGRD